MPTPTSTAALPDGIEIFRAGRHTDDAGNVHDFSEADVRRMAEVYDPKLREAPLTIGHPEHNLPAYGWVKALAVNSAGRLVMNTHKVIPQFAEMVRTEMFKKRSTSFYPPSHPNNPAPGAWYPRHVGFLGAQQPAIAGLADIQFSEGEATGLVQFSEATPSTPTPSQEQIDMDEELKKKLAAAEAATAEEKAKREAAERERDDANKRATSFAEQQKKERTASFTSFAEAQVKAGRLLPVDQSMAVATQEALAGAEPVSFSEGNTTRTVSPLEWFQKLMSDAKPLVSFGEFAPSRIDADGVQVGAAKGKSDEEVHKAAQAYALEHKVSYAEAARAVVGFTN